jgi:hypothetical protein
VGVQLLGRGPDDVLLGGIGFADLARLQIAITEISIALLHVCPIVAVSPPALHDESASDLDAVSGHGSITSTSSAIPCGSNPMIIWNLAQR